MKLSSHHRCYSVAIVLCLLAARVMLAAPPDNDDLASLRTLDMSVPDTSTTVEATLESGETIPTGYTSTTYQGSVWWEAAIEFPGWYEINTAGSAVDTVVGVWATSSGTYPLAQVHANEGSPGRVYVFLNGSPTDPSYYKISVASRTAARGSVTVEIQFRANSPFSQVTAATFTPSSADVSTGAVTVQADVTLQSRAEIASGTITIYSPTNTLVATASVSGSNRVSGVIASGVYRMFITIPQGSAAGSCRWGITLNSTSENSSYGWLGLTPLPAGVPRTITVVNNPPADPYSTWASSYGLSGGDAARSADLDGDGIKNLTEYQCGLSPLNNLVPVVAVSGASITQTGLPSISITGSGATARLRVLYLHRLGDSTVTATVQFSDDNVNWTNAANSASVQATNASYEALAVEDQVFDPVKTRRFARVRYVYTP